VRHLSRAGYSRSVLGGVTSRSRLMPRLARSSASVYAASPAAASRYGGGSSKWSRSLHMRSSSAARVTSFCSAKNRSVSETRFLPVLGEGGRGEKGRKGREGEGGKGKRG